MDDDDAFLYGSDTENTAESASQINKQTASTNTLEVITTEQGTVESEQPSEQNDNNMEIDDEPPAAEDPQEDSDFDSGSESDSDVEFIIGLAGSKPVIAESKLPLGVTAIAEAGIEKHPTSTSGAIQIKTVPIFTTSNGLDIDKIGLYNDIPVTELSLDELKDKPWRLPGADISDYFNYGFDEVSWRAYCAKNEKLRNDFNPGKVITELLSTGSIPPTLAQIFPGGTSGAGSAPGSLPPFMMGMPGFMGMPNMPNMPNMPGIPGMPNLPNMQNMANLSTMTGMNNMNNMNNNANNLTAISNVSSIPNKPTLPNRTSNTPDPNLRDPRDQADKDLEKGNKDREDRGERREREDRVDRRDRDRDWDRERNRDRDRERDRNRDERDDDRNRRRRRRR